MFGVKSCWTTLQTSKTHVIHVDSALEYRARHDSALTADAEAVVDGEEKWRREISLCRRFRQAVIVIIRPTNVIVPGGSCEFYPGN